MRGGIKSYVGPTSKLQPYISSFMFHKPLFSLSHFNGEMPLSLCSEPENIPVFFNEAIRPSLKFSTNFPVLKPPTEINEVNFLPVIQLRIRPVRTTLMGEGRISHQETHQHPRKGKDTSHR